jgi:inhibitor of Bruton tyrosine kinase
MFDMDDLDGSPLVKHVRPQISDETKNPWRDVKGKPLKEQPPTYSSNQRFRIAHESLSADLNGNETWSEARTPGKGYVLSFTTSDHSKREDTKSVENTPRSSQAAASRPSPQSRSTSGIQSPTVPLTSSGLLTPGSSPWKKPDSSPAIPFKSLQKEQANQTLSSTFPPSTLSDRSVQSRPNPSSPPKSPPTPSTISNPPRRNATTPTSAFTTPSQIRSVPGKSFQQKPSPRSPAIPEMFPVLGSSPQNLSDIIAQQASEQKALSAKTSPRSLKEIQEEEQFLQWWEQESQRVQEEEEIVAKMREMSMREERGRGQKTRGSGSGGGGGRGRGMRGRGDGKGRGRGDAVRGDFGRGHVHNNRGN